MKQIKVAFFTEAGSQRGMGHLARCKAIEQEFSNFNIYADFFLDSDIDYSYKYENINYFQWSKFNLDNIYDFIIIDSYEAGKPIYEIISNRAKVPVYLDDYRRIDYPRGVIINFSPGAEDKFYKEKSRNNLYLLGVPFIPIRSQIIKSEKNNENDLFLMLGGQDTCNLTERIVAAIDTSSKKIVVSNNKETFGRISNKNDIIPLYKPSDGDLVKHLASSKFAITTASMTAYELNFLDIPSIIISVSANQEIGAVNLIKHRISDFHVSTSRKDWIQEVVERYETLIAKNKSNQLKSVDGHGCTRIVKTLLTVL